MPEKEAPEIKAHQEVYTALKGLDSETRRLVLSSVLALLGMQEVPSIPTPVIGALAGSKASGSSPVATASRPFSLIELMKEKNPSTNAQRIALFAYYREKYEGFQRFERDDLKPYFAKAKLSPSGNYDREGKRSREHRRHSRRL